MVEVGEHEKWTNNTHIILSKGHFTLDLRALPIWYTNYVFGREVGDGSSSFLQV